MKTIALILARGGSKGIPNKNIMQLAGKPLLSYSIEAAKSIGLKTFVSTDSDEIASVAEQYGAICFKRDVKNARDESKSEEALIEFCSKFYFDNLVFIQPTSPLLDGDDILAGLELYKSYDSVFSAYKDHWLPKWTIDGEPFCWNKDKRPRRQDIEPMYIENGAFYITKRDGLLTSKCRYNGNIGIYEMPFSKSFQVDTYDDIKIIESLLNFKRV